MSARAMSGHSHTSRAQNFSQMEKTLLCDHPRTATLPDGTEVRLVVPIERTKNRALYTTADGRAFSHVRVKDKTSGESRWEFHQLSLSPTNLPCSKANGRRRQIYLHLRSDYGAILMHHAVALAWIGPRSNGCECDHLNGITTDNRVCNLQWVTRKENEKRAVILRARRMIAREDKRPELLPENMKPEELLALFNAYNVAGDAYDAMEDDMTHHREI